MKHQKDPTPERLTQLAAGNPIVEVEWGEVTPSSLDAAQRNRIEDVRRRVTEARDLLPDHAGRVIDPVIAEALAELCRRIGTQLRALNATGLFISADRRSEDHILRDPESGTEHAATIDIVHLWVLRPTL